MKNWTGEWPTKPGHYWFYGWKYKPIFEMEPYLSMVTVRLDSTKSPMYITDGHFMYKAEGARGLWLPITLPELPDRNLLP